jgi:hypothetical protein
MALERRRSGGLGGINWRITPERILIRLGIADPTDRTAGEAAMQRRLIDVALAADRTRTLSETGAGTRRVNRARRRLQRVMRRAVEDGGLVESGRAPRAMLLDNLRILSSTGALLDLDLPNPWTTDDHPDPLAVREPAAAALPAAASSAETSSRSAGPQLPPTATPDALPAASTTSGTPNPTPATRLDARTESSDSLEAQGISATLPGTVAIQPAALTPVTPDNSAQSPTLPAPAPNDAPRQQRITASRDTANPQAEPGPSDATDSPRASAAGDPEDSRASRVPYDATNSLVANGERRTELSESAGRHQISPDSPATPTEPAVAHDSMQSQATQAHVAGVPAQSPAPTTAAAPAESAAADDTAESRAAARAQAAEASAESQAAPDRPRAGPSESTPDREASPEPPNPATTTRTHRITRGPTVRITADPPPRRSAPARPSASAAPTVTPETPSPAWVDDYPTQTLPAAQAPHRATPAATPPEHTVPEPATSTTAARGKPTTPQTAPTPAADDTPHTTRQVRRDPTVRHRVRELRETGTPATEIAAQLGTSARTIRRIVADLEAESAAAQQIPVRPLQSRNLAQTAVSGWHNGFHVLSGENVAPDNGSHAAPSIVDERRTNRPSEN